MSRTPQERRPRAQRLGVVGLGAAALLAGTTSVAGAATGVVIPLAPSAVILSTFPVENFGAMDPMADPDVALVPTPEDVLYGGTITVDLPAELDDAAVEAELAFDDDGDGTADETHSTAPEAGETLLAIDGQGTGSIEVTLPADPGLATDVAVLSLSSLGSTLGPAFSYLDELSYELAFDPAADAAVVVEPQLVAISQVPCDISSATRCPFPTPVTAGSTLALDLTPGSVLRELGVADLTGAQVGLQQVDAVGDPVGAPALLTPQTAGSTASLAIPAGTAAGSYGLVIAQPTPTGGISVVAVELTVLAEQTPAVLPPAAAPTTPTTAVNVGLRSNTGVEAVEAVGTGTTGTVAVATGAGLLLLAGAGGIAVARTRRRPAAEGGTWQA
jgi:hypothetical protein